MTLLPGGRRPAAALRAVLSAVAVCLLSCLLAGLLVPRAAGASTSAGRDDDPVPAPAAGAPWFGPTLDWAQDLPADYSRRLGETPSLYSQRVSYPLGAEDATYLRQFGEQAATQGAVAVLTLEPDEALADLGADDADDLADALVELHRAYDSYVLVRFAPEMNGTWTPWGQQPTAYVEAFRTVADAVHEATEHAAMVWSPSYGAGYPFGASARAVDPSGQVEVDVLDTDGDGTLDEADDPYAPYYPGDEAVDWVGLSLFSFGGTETEPAGPDGVNEVPAAGSFEARLDETWGYADDTSRESFYDRFAAPGDTPVLLDTAALWVPDAGGAGSREIKQDWWRQVLAALPQRPLVAALTWLEVERPEDEAGGRTVDWRATVDGLGRPLREDLRAAGVDLGPVTNVLDLETANTASAQGRVLGTDLGNELDWIVLCAVLLAALFLFAGFAGRFLPSWRYPDEHDPRDRRLDLLRGMIIITVVVTHIELDSPYSFVSLKAIGAITGAEMFVLLSGVVLGMIYEPTVRKLGERATAVVMLKRARKQYVVALVVVVLVYLLGRLPLVDASDITTFTDRGTGENGGAVAGQVYDLYANFPRLFDYPPPGYAIRQLLLLEMGPWVFNIMGLFVVLSLLLPALMWLIRRRMWWVVLAVSWAGYVYATIDDPHWLPSQFEAVFPLLIWQVAFTHGLVVGYYRRQITRVLTTRPGKVATAAFVVGYAAVLAWIWWGNAHGGPAPAPLPADSYAWLLENFYIRVFLQPGRLIDLVLVVVVAFAVLTTCWKPIDKAIGWLWIPMGQASLYVFIVHVFFALAVANVPGLDRMSFWQGTLIHTVVVLVIWAMVKRQVLFSVIPR